MQPSVSPIAQGGNTKHKEVMSFQARQGMASGDRVLPLARRTVSQGAVPQRGEIRSLPTTVVQESRLERQRAAQRSDAPSGGGDMSPSRTPEFSTPDQGKRRMVAAKAKADERQKAEAAEAASLIQTVSGAASSAASAEEPRIDYFATIREVVAEATGLKANAERMRYLESVSSGLTSMSCISVSHSLCLPCCHQGRPSEGGGTADT